MSFPQALDQIPDKIMVEIETECGTDGSIICGKADLKQAREFAASSFGCNQCAQFSWGGYHESQLQEADYVMDNEGRVWLHHEKEWVLLEHRNYRENRR